MTILTFTKSFVLDYRRPDAGGKCPIYLRIIKNRSIATVKVGEYVHPKYWDKSSGRALPKEKDYVRINHRLISIEKQVDDIRFSLEKENKNIDAKGIISLLRGSNSPEIKLLEFIDVYVDEMRARPAEFTPSVNRHYLQMRGRLHEYLKKNHAEKMLLKEVSAKFLDEWKQYLLTTNAPSIDRPLNLNTTNRYLVKLRAVFNKAVMRELISKSPFANFKIKEVAGKRDYLTLDELNRLAVHPLENNLSLIRVRDAFVFSCYCPCRFNDLIKFRLENFYADGDGITWVAYTVQKTGTPVEIPLFKEALAIYTKYSVGKREQDELLFKGISNQKFNTFLATCAQLAGIKKKLTHHVSRHTAASTVLLGRGVGIREVSSFLSHQSLSSTMIYTKMSKSTMGNIVKRIDNLT